MKRLAIAAAVATVVLLALAAGAVYWFFSGDGVRVAIERQASAWLGEPVRIGSATARLFPRVGIALGDVRVGEPVHLTLAEADVSTDLRALLSRRIEDADLVVSNSRVELPLPAIPESGEPADAGAGEESSPAMEIVSIRTISLRDIRVVSRGRELVVSADSTLEGNRLTIRSFTAASGATELDAEGIANLSPRLEAQLRVRANRLDVDELVALADAFSPERTPGSPGSAPDAAAQSGAGLPGRIAARVSAETATAAGVEVSQFLTDFQMDGNRVALSPLRFQLFGGRYEGDLDATLGETMAATLRSQIEEVDVAQLAEFGGVAGTVTGRLTAAATVAGQGADLAAALNGARGDGTVQIEDGTIQGLDLVRTVVLFFGRPAPDAAPSSDRFDRFDATWTLANNTFRATALSLRSPDADIVGSGTLHIPTKALDGRLDMSLSPELSKQAGTDFARFTREGDRIVLPALVGGTLADPSLTIDAAAAVKRGLRNEVERRLKDLLGGFGR